MVPTTNYCNRTKDALWAALFHTIHFGITVKLHFQKTKTKDYTLFHPNCNTKRKDYPSLANQNLLSSKKKIGTTKTTKPT